MKQFKNLRLGDMVWVTVEDSAEIIPTRVAGVGIATHYWDRLNVTVEGGGLLPRPMKFCSVECANSSTVDRDSGLRMFCNLEEAQTWRVVWKDIAADKIQRKLVNLCKELKKLDKNTASIRMRIQQVFQLLDSDK